jgi:BlaI family penicillinase repressor
MAPTPSRLPTSSELAILQVIWQHGSMTVREVYRAMAQDRDIGYSTVLKFMQIMTEKGMLVRDETVRPQVYRSARPRHQVQKGILRDLVARAFGGSPVSLVMQLLSDTTPTSDERRRIRALLESLDAGRPRRRRKP